jgi:hypothetical protein
VQCGCSKTDLKIIFRLHRIKFHEFYSQIIIEVKESHGRKHNRTERSNVENESTHKGTTCEKNITIKTAEGQTCLSR